MNSIHKMLMDEGGLSVSKRFFILFVKPKFNLPSFPSLNENKTAHCVEKCHILLSNILVYWFILCRIRLISLILFV